MLCRWLEWEEIVAACGKQRDFCELVEGDRNRARQYCNLLILVCFGGSFNHKDYKGLNVLLVKGREQVTLHFDGYKTVRWMGHQEQTLKRGHKLCSIILDFVNNNNNRAGWSSKKWKHFAVVFDFGYTYFALSDVCFDVAGQPYDPQIRAKKMCDGREGPTDVGLPFVRVQVYRFLCSINKRNVQILDLPPEELDHLLGKFFKDVRKVGGDGQVL
ncbi:hypothetical protein ACROYT_G014605 [Oculina patagonica]